VRVPLRGRRVRGWVVATSPDPGPGSTDELALIAGVSGRAPVFDEPLLAAARAMAWRFVHPLSAFLHLMTPPQMGRAMGRRAAAPGAAVGLSAAPPFPPNAGTRTLRRLGPRDDPTAAYAQAIEDVLATGRGAIVVVPEVRAGSLVLEGLQRAFPEDAAVVHSGQEPVDRSRALWQVARGERRVVLGGRAAALVPTFPLGLVVVHAEEDRTLKEQRSPYYDARDVAEIRAGACGADLLLASECPALRTWHRATTAAPPWRLEEPGRPEVRSVWPPVELLDPTKNVMPQRAVAAVLDAWRGRTRALVFLPRREQTTAGPGPAEVAAYLRRAAPGARVERADPLGLGGEGSLEEALRADIVVATEGALADVERPAVGTVVALGVDALLHRPAGRAVEDAFAVLWELACLVARGPGRGRLLLETDSPGHHAIQAVVRGDYHFFARHEADSRRVSNAPPFSTIVRIRATAGRRGGTGMGETVLERLRALPGTELLGPVEGRLGAEVLLKVGNLDAVLGPLRAVVASAQERLLVEMDPREW
jgi:primosomal protein N'